LVFLKYPFKLSDRIGDFIGNKQMEFANARMEKRLRVRKELEEIHFRLEQELAKDPLEEQFDELERKEYAEQCRARKI
jgi:hypothetical protein